MPRIYKPVGPSTNKAAAPVKETKTPEKKSETPKSNEEKGGGQ